MIRVARQFPTSPPAFILEVPVIGPGERGDSRMAACAPGYSSDGILRLPLGPWQDAPGTDCYRSDAGIAVFAGVLLMVCAVGSIMLVVEIADNKKLTVTMRRAHMLSLAVLASIIAVLVIAIVKQAWTFWAWALMIAVNQPWVICYYSVLFNNCVAVLYKIVPEKSRMELAGGAKWVMVGGSCVMICLVATLVGSIGTAVAVDRADYGTAHDFWTLMCVAWAIFTAVAIAHVYQMYVGFAVAIERVVNAVEANADGLARSGDAARAVATQFRRASLGALAALPIGCGLWAAHAAVLPMWWWIVMLHVINIINGVMLVSFANTSQSRRRRVFGLLTCFSVLPNISSGANPGSSPADSASSNPAIKKRQLSALASSPSTL